jgi:phage recombination protein Bet
MTVSNELTEWQEQNKFLVARGIDESTWSALCTSVYPGANPDSIVMAIDYCKARKLDIMLKPVHLVPMSIKTAGSDKYEMRDVPMPGVGLYRIQASRSGDYAGSDEPEFGPLITQEFTGQDYNKKEIKKTFTYPEWCKYTVYKLIGDRVVGFSAKEYWLENYATQSKYSEMPNAMWAKRIYGQLGKCTEAQALRKAWPEIGQEPTAEEMEGKHYMEKEINPQSSNGQATVKQIAEKPEFTQDMLNAKSNKWANSISKGSDPQDLIDMLNEKYTVSESIANQILNINQEEAA